MKELIRKEFKLTISPATYIYILVMAVLLAPSYPYLVVMSFPLMGIMTSFFQATANKDHEFTSMLPITRNDIVKARFISTIGSELISFLFAIPFAILSSLVVNKSGNIVGFDANMALFGISLIGYALFNIIFLPWYFKTGYKCGIAFLVSMLTYLLFVIIVQVLAYIFPFFMRLDGIGGENLIFHAVTLGVGLAVFVIGVIVSYFMSCKNFEKVSL